MDKNVKQIITDIDKLSEFSDTIDTRKEGKLLQEIVLSLKATMRENNLVSLTAPQIGYNKRVICLRFGERDYRTFVNPVIENNTGFHFATETCSSLEGKRYVIPRFGNIKGFFTTPMGKVEAIKLSGMAALKFQHCIDHLNGMLTSDIGLEIDELWDNASEDERAEVLKMYAESLDIRQKELDKAVQEDAELSDIADAARFIASVKSGETTIENLELKNSNE